MSQESSGKIKQNSPSYQGKEKERKGGNTGTQSPSSPLVQTGWKKVTGPLRAPTALQHPVSHFLFPGFETGSQVAQATLSTSLENDLELLILLSSFLGVTRKAGKVVICLWEGRGEGGFS